MAGVLYGHPPYLHFHHSKKQASLARKFLGQNPWTIVPAPSLTDGASGIGRHHYCCDAWLPLVSHVEAGRRLMCPGQRIQKRHWGVRWQAPVDNGASGQNEADRRRCSAVLWWLRRQGLQRRCTCRKLGLHCCSSCVCRLSLGSGCSFPLLVPLPVEGLQA